MIGGDKDWNWLWIDELIDYETISIGTNSLTIKRPLTESDRDHLTPNQRNEHKLIAREYERR